MENSWPPSPTGDVAREVRYANQRGDSHNTRSYSDHGEMVRDGVDGRRVSHPRQHQRTNASECTGKGFPAGQSGTSAVDAASIVLLQPPPRYEYVQCMLSPHKVGTDRPLNYPLNLSGSTFLPLPLPAPPRPRPRPPPRPLRPPRNPICPPSAASAAPPAGSAAILGMRYPGTCLRWGCCRAGWSGWSWRR